MASGRRSGGRTAASPALHLRGVPNERQRLFFASRAKYTAYGGARGGGKSWALRRKLILLCLHYPGITCLIIRRSYPELRQNHILPLRRELGERVTYRESEKCFLFPPVGGKSSRIFLGHLSSARDLLRYQGQEYDIIAIDEATQLTEEQFSALKACLRGTNSFPKRMYLTCNPGGVGHAWVKRLFVDRDFREGEAAADYLFIPAKVYDNTALLERSPEYLSQLRSLPPRLRAAWLDGSWNVFDGQFFSEFREECHVIPPFPLIGDGAPRLRFFAAMDYGFDMLALLLLALDEEGKIYAVGERAVPGLTLSMAARELSELTRDFPVEYVAASPDLWNRRQDTGYSGFEIIRGQEQQGCVPPLPPLIPADNRRVEGWRALREALAVDGRAGGPRLRIFSCCPELIRCLPALVTDQKNPEDASSRPHSVTHLPEALRYGVMSRMTPPAPEQETLPPFFSHRRTKRPSIYAY